MDRWGALGGWTIDPRDPACLLNPSDWQASLAVLLIIWQWEHPVQLCSTTVCSSVIKIMALGFGALRRECSSVPEALHAWGGNFHLLPVFYLLIILSPQHDS